MGKEKKIIKEEIADKNPVIILDYEAEVAEDEWVNWTLTSRLELKWSGYLILIALTVILKNQISQSILKI